MLGEATHSYAMRQIFSKQTTVVQVRVQRSGGKVNGNISYGHAERFALKALSCEIFLPILEIKE